VVGSGTVAISMRICCTSFKIAPPFMPGSSLDHLQAASIQYRIAIGPHADRKALTLYILPPTKENSDIPLLAESAYTRYCRMTVSYMA
jgi:hypothetical protein